jgi:hypothetical protein
MGKYLVDLDLLSATFWYNNSARLDHQVHIFVHQFTISFCIFPLPRQALLHHSSIPPMAVHAWFIAPSDELVYLSPKV